MAPDLPINSSAAGGPAQGNYFPNSFGSVMAQQQRQGSVNLMEIADTYNPATRALSRAAGRGLSGASTSRQLDDYLNYTRSGFFVQQGARAMQGVMGHGSFTDLAYGAQQAIGGGGLRMGMGGGGSQLISGGGMVTDALAKRTFDRLSSHYYDDRGMARNANTMGRDNAGLSRAIQLVAASGQLSGTEAFSFGKLSTVERLQNTYADMRAAGRGNEAGMIKSTIDRIKGGGYDDVRARSEAENLMKSANSKGYDGLGKAIKSSVMDTDMGFKESTTFMKNMQGGVKSLMELHDTMKDIFGDISDLESMNMGSQITGVSVNGFNAFAKIRSGMEKIKGDAAALGVGAAPYAQSVAQFGGMYGQVLGSAAFGGTLASMYTPSFYRGARESQDAANARGGGRVYKEQDIAAESVRDVGDYSKESGATAAAQLLWRAANDPNVKKDPALRARIHAAIKAHGNASVGAEKSATTRDLLALTDETGKVNLSNDAIMSSIADTPQGAMLAEMTASGVNRSLGHLYRKRGRDAGGSGSNPLGSGVSDYAGDVLMQLHSAVGLSGGDKIGKLLSEGKSTEAFALIDKDASYFRGIGIDPADLKARINTGASMTRGGMGAFGGALESISATMNSAGENKNIDSYKGRMTDASNKSFRALMDAQTGDVRSQKESLGRVVADIMFSGGNLTKINQKDVSTYAVATGNISDKFGVNSDTGTMNFSDAQLDKWAGNKDLMSKLGISTRDELKAYASDTNKTHGLLMAFKEAGYSTVGAPMDGGASGIALISKENSQLAESQMTSEAYKKYYKGMGIDLTPEEQARLASGEEISSDPGRLKDIKKAEKGALYDKITGKKSKGDYSGLNKDVLATKRGQRVKDAIYGNNSEKAGYLLQALQTPGVLTDDQRSMLFKDLQNDDQLKNKISKMGIDTTGFKDDSKSWDIIQQGLAKTAGVDYKSKIGDGQVAGQTMANLTVQNMTVIKQS